MKYYHFLFFIVFVGFTACEDTLNPKLTNDFGEEWTWGHPEKAQGVLMNSYNAINGRYDSYGGNNFLDAATDNAVTNDYTSSIYHLGSGGLSSSSNPLSNWNTAYSQFQYINNFIEKGLDSAIIYWLSDENVDAEFRIRLTGESYFLRAWWGMEVLRVYGGLTNDGEALGYPIVTHFIESDEQEEAKMLKRNTYEECALQIMEDCDSAINYLPADYGGGDLVEEVYGSGSIGRATSKAAHALKSRVALYAASPAFQPKGDFLISQDSIRKRWERAAYISYRAIKDGNLGKYRHLSKYDMSGGDLKTTPSRFLFRKYFNNRSMEVNNLPPAIQGAGRTNPSQNLVDAFAASNGYPITDSRSGYNDTLPYSNRDPRLATTILANGNSIELGGRRVEIFYDADNKRPGLDAPGSDYRATRTGYYLKKWLSDKQDMLNTDNMLKAEHMMVYLREAEVWFNYAEASNEAAGALNPAPGCDEAAYKILGDIRQANYGIGADNYLDEVASRGQDDLRELIQNERRCEFAFENLRYFDMRRWLLPLNDPIFGVYIEKENGILNYYYHQSQDGKYTHNPADEKIVVEERKFDDAKYYYAPLPYDELLKTEMKNNKGW